MIKPSVASDFIRSKAKGFNPKIGIILGSGSDFFADQLKNTVTIPFSEIPGFYNCGVKGHSGKLVLGTLNEVSVACLQGRGHFYEGHRASDLQLPVRALKLLGCEVMILTNAAASLREEVTPGDLVIINDHINFQFQNPLVGPNDIEFGVRFPSLQQAYDENLIQLALASAAKLLIPISTGVYLATLGPSYETPAEIRAFKLLGADLVGMSTVPEVIIARHCGLRVLAVSIISNMGCGMSSEILSHESVLKMASTAGQRLSLLLTEILGSMKI